MRDFLRTVEATPHLLMSALIATGTTEVFAFNSLSKFLSEFLKLVFLLVSVDVQ